MKRTIVGLSFVLLASAASFAWALPTEQQVEAEVRQGHYTQAESMMSEVVAAKPNSAKAHYVYAELLARNGSFAKASEQAARAREIDPAIKFMDANEFRAFEQTLQRAQNPPTRSRAVTTTPTAPAFNSAATTTGSSGSGIPGWVWFAGLIVLAIVLWRGFMRSRATAGSNLAPAGMQPNMQPNAYGASAINPGAQYGPYGQGGVPAGRPGSGLLGTGLAVAGGVAGGMLLDEMLHKHSDGTGNNLAGLGPDNYNPAGNSAANELENRPVDFGSGDDWDSGGGSADLGGGSDSGGGGWD